MGFGHAPFGHHPFGHPGLALPQIQDLAYNALASPSTAQMLGWTAPAAGPQEYGLDIYRFILASIRKEDEKAILFLKRFLQGPQTLWESIQSRVFAMQTLWDVAHVDDEFLPYLQNIVGWTGELTAITDALDVATLRRLIATSIALWRERGPEDAMIDVLRLTTTAQARIWNWFDYRWILDETQLGEEHQGRDPWMIELPGSSGMDEYRSNLRIVDDGTLDRVLVVNLIKLMRAVGERIEIAYIDFMDLFTIDGDDAKWTVPAGTLVVSDGTAKLEDDSIEELVVADNEPSEWSDYVLFGRVKGTSTGGDFGLAFYNDGTADNGYYAALDLATNRVKLLRVIAGVQSIYTSVPYRDWGVLRPDVYYGLRVQATAEGATQRLKVYVDGDEIINGTQPTYSSGTYGIWHEVGATVECDEVELFRVPLETELVDINS